MKLVIETESENNNILFDTSKLSMDLNNNKNIYEANYNINLYNIENDNKELAVSISGIYYDIIYIIENDLDLYEILNQKIKDNSLLEKIIDTYGEIRGEYLSSFLNLYFIEKIKIEDKYKDKNYDILLLSNIIKILMFKDKKIIGNIIIKPELDYFIDESSTPEYYKYEDKLNKLINSYKNCGFEKIENTKYMILVNE